MASVKPSFLERLFRRGRGVSPGRGCAPAPLAAVPSRVDDSPGWTTLTHPPHDYDPAQVQELYQDALTAWRKNPIAWRIIAITTDYVVGDTFSISCPNRSLNRFISAFWHHPKNRLDLRLETMCDELSRSGDLFVLLFRNPQDGMSYIRFVTKDQIIRIETAANDWETELAYYRAQAPTASSAAGYPPTTPHAGQAPAIMLHYAVNRPAGALLGESDLTTMIPWLQRYCRMLEDRVRLHWAVRSFLWLVTVPANKIQEKREQYRTPPDTGCNHRQRRNAKRWEAITPHAPRRRRPARPAGRARHDRRRQRLPAALARRSRRRQPGHRQRHARPHRAPPAAPPAVLPLHAPGHPLPRLPARRRDRASIPR